MAQKYCGKQKVFLQHDYCLTFFMGHTELALARQKQGLMDEALKAYRKVNKCTFNHVRKAVCQLNGNLLGGRNLECRGPRKV